MQLLLVRVIVVAVLFNLAAQHSRADGSSQKGLTAALQKFTLPEIPDDIEQKLRDYVPNDLKRRRDEGNSRSTAEWEKIKTREEWEAFRKEKVKLLRESLGLSFRKADWKPPQLIGAAEISGTIKGEGYRIDKMLYRSSYGPWISANLYVPEPAREKMPGFIISHAHHTPKENGELQDMGVMWARAGCYVLVPDHLGHGERRQHLFKSKDDYDKPFQVSRQDYYFRYDVNLQLNLIGESLMGCLALDLMTGVSLLHAMPGIDKDKIILLGAVAGGGDPCAVTAALDERITCAAPFNFGGPQPETRYPLPEGVDFNYGGSGGWESTRNLAYSYRDGTLPWVIVGSIAPRRLIYAHEFAWDREHDPVWKRFEKIYGWYDKPDHLSFAHGHGTLTSKDPPGSHCTHIGKTHRKQMHEALAKWFDIKLPGGEESTDRHDAAELRCWTEEAKSKLPEVSLQMPLQTHWKNVKSTNFNGGRPPQNSALKISWESENMKVDSVTAKLIMLESERRLIPVILFEPKTDSKQSVPTVLVITRRGKEQFVRQRAQMIAELVAAGVRVALPDLFSSGLTGNGNDLGRRSGNTGRSSTLAMYGLELANVQFGDALATLNWLKGNMAEPRVALWSDSLVSPNTPDAKYAVPRDDDGQLPAGPDPLPQRVAWLLASRNRNCPIYVRGGVDSLGSTLDAQLTLLPHDAAPLPRLYQADFVTPPSDGEIRLDETVNVQNQRVGTSEDPQTAATWLLQKLKSQPK
jgi:dienelactone hydrolase